MEINDSFNVPASTDEVWEMFQDVPSLVACMPGVELTKHVGDDVYEGRMIIRLGPMKPAFEGQARIERDDATRSGIITAKGKDRKGGSRADATVTFSVHSVDAGSRVDLVSSLKMMGQLAQFGRTNLMQDVTAQLTAEFANCLTAKINAPTPEAAESVKAAEIQPFAALLALLQLRLRRAMKRVGEWLVARSGDA